MFRMLKQVFSSAYCKTLTWECHQFLKHKFQKPLCENLSKTFFTTVKTSSTNELKGGAKKGFLLYHYPDFNVNIARLFSVCGAVACGSAYMTVNDLRSASEEKEPEVEVSEKTTEFSDSIYGGKFGVIAPYLYGVAGVTITFLTRRFVNSTLKKVLLSTDRQTVTFVSYQLFGKDKILTVPVEQVSWKKSKIRVKNYVGKFHLMKPGKITNRSLLDWALNVYGGPKRPDQKF